MCRRVSAHGKGAAAVRRAIRACALGAVLGALGAPAAAAQTRPNVVVIMADDLDVHSLETMLRLGLMPAFKENFVDRGIRFTESFVTNSLCCPSRATFLSGQYSHNHGAFSNAGPYGGIVRFKDEATLATWLDAEGYHTGHIGKYLNGYGLNYVLEPDWPVPQYSPTYRPPGWDDWQPLVDTTTYLVYGYALNDNGTLVRYGDAPEDYQTRVLATRAAAFLAAAPRPFFLSVAPLAPHVEVQLGMGQRWRDVWQWSIRPAPEHEGTVKLPLLPALKPSFNEADLTDKPIWRPQLDAEDFFGIPGTSRGGLLKQYHSRLESLRAVDDLVRDVFAALRSRNVLADTVVIFTSDNGFLYGEHRLSEKLTAYEESIRVPLYVRVPWAATPRAMDEIVINTDLAPSIAELAGAAPDRAVDGVSLVPLLRDVTPSPWRRRFLVEHWWTDSVFEVPTYAALRTGVDDATAPRTLYVEYDDANYGQAEDGVADPVMFRELYDLATDPFQIESLHREPSRGPLMEALGRVLAGLRTCGGDLGHRRCQDLEK